MAKELIGRHVRLCIQGKLLSNLRPEYPSQTLYDSYGFLSENATFSRRLAQEGIVFIGPPESAIVSMGSKR